jgi:anti-anti-sigma factor
MPPPSFDIASVQHGGDLFVTITGELDLIATSQLETVLNRQRPKQTIVVDLTGLDFIDSSGIRAILLLWKRAQAEGFDLRLTSSTPEVMKAFELVGLLDELPFNTRA